MKRKVFLVLLISAILACAFAIAASAKTYICVDENSKELFRYEIADGTNYPITSYSGDGFAKYDSDGDALTWYWSSTTTLESGETQYTIASAKTKALVIDDGDGILTSSEITNYSKLVSITFDEDCGITEFGKNNNNSGLFHKTANQYYFLFVNIPDSVTTLSNNCFRNCVSLINVGISENSKLTDLGTASFFGCTSLRSIYIPKGVTTLRTEYISDVYWENGLFRNCQKLEEVTFAEDSSLEVLEKGTFNHCNSLKEITLPNSVKTVHPRAFAYCPVLEDVNFGAGLVEIVREANSSDAYVSMFQYSTNLKTVVLPATFKAENLADDLNTTFSIEGITIYYAGTEEEFVKLQEKFALATEGSGNKGITKATYNYISPCVAFYDGEHIEKTIIKYPNGFDNKGTKIFGCTRESCTKNEITETLEIFEALGYSVPEDNKNDGIYAGFRVSSKDAYNEYVSVMGELKYGIAIANANGISTLVELTEDGSVTMTAQTGLVVDISNPEYSTFNLSIRGFNDEIADTLSLVISAYVVADGDADGEREVTFVQHEMANEDNLPVNGFNTVTLNRAYYNLYPEKKEEPVLSA